MLRSLHYEFRSHLACHPALYLPIARQRHGSANSSPKTDVYAGLTLCPKTSLVLEGFPRSGNTFACKAFLMEQGNRVTLAHHLHSPTQVMAAGELGIPALVLVRQPVDAVCSLLQWERGITPKQALRSWIRFYECLVSYQDHFIVATFDQVTTDFGSVIERLNTRYQTSFNRFNHAPENEEKIFREIERIDAIYGGKGIIAESRVARPSSERARVKVGLAKLLNHESLSTHRRKAERLFSLFSQWAE